MIEDLFLKMFEFYSGDPHQIQHFIKVHSFSRRIGIAERLECKQLMVLEAAAIVHDIGIKAAMQKYGSDTGKLQEQEGPPLAQAILESLNAPKDVIDRVCYLVGRHHTYVGIDDIDCQILVEADFLVNLHENNASAESIESVMRKIFKTKSGLKICRLMFFQPKEAIAG